MKIGTPLTRAVENVYANFDSSAFLCLRVTSPQGTDGRTDGQARRVTQPIAVLALIRTNSNELELARK